LLLKFIQLLEEGGSVRKSRKYLFVTALFSSVLTIVFGSGTSRSAIAQSKLNIYQATLEEPNQMTPEISTEELKNLLAGVKPVVVIDTRPMMQYALAHIPGAINVGEKEEEHIPQAYSDKATLMIVYCNGPY
jgi:hypothetical protein